MKFTTTKADMYFDYFKYFGSEIGKKFYKMLPDDLELEGEPIQTLKDCFKDGPNIMSCDHKDCTHASENPKKIEELPELCRITEKDSKDIREMKKVINQIL